MSELPEEWRERLQELSFGGYYGTMWRWTFHDGSTWAYIMAEGEQSEPIQARHIVGWSCLTLQEEPHPVLGVYVDQWRRGRGLASTLVRQILTYCRHHLDGQVYAVSANFGRYPQILKEFDQKHLEWE